MTLQQLKDLIAGGNMAMVIDILDLHCTVNNICESLKQYDPKQHEIMNKRKYRDKLIKDDGGNITKKVEVTRLPLPLQKKIVLLGAAFLGTPEVDSTPEGDIEEKMSELVNAVWDLNKLDYKFMAIAKYVMSERHCAEIWYTQEADPTYWADYPITTKLKLGMKLLANSLGDDLYPVFDEFGDMIAFGRVYKLKELVGTDVKVVDHFDLYTKDEIYFSKNVNGSWEFDVGSGKGFVAGEVVAQKNLIGKIPVMYYNQPAVEWEDVQALIERVELRISRHGDTNDYVGSPIIFCEGDVEGFADKGEEGKVLVGKNGAKVSYLTWDSAPESTKMEINNLMYYIHSLTHTPDISFENVKGLGQLSGIALQLLFMDAHLKATDKEPIFGEGLQRRINYIKKSLSVFDASLVKALPMRIKPKFTYYKLEDIAGVVTTLNAAVEGGILSTDSAIRQNPLVTDPESELLAIQKEQDAAAAKALELANAQKPAIPEPAKGDPKMEVV